MEREKRMIRNRVWGICLASLVQLTGCVVEEDDLTCRIVFDYTYDQQGHIKEVTLDENGDDSIDARVTYSNTYHEDGWIREVVTTGIRSNDRVKYTTIHELNESGRTVYSLYEGEEVSVRIHEYGETKSVEQRTFSYTAEYDDDRHLISAIMDLDADDTPDERELNTYDEDGNREKYEIDEGADGTIDFTIKYTYTYTEQGKTESIVHEEIGLITVATEYTYTYDDEGRETGRTTDIRQDGNPEEVCTTSFDDEGERSFCEKLVNGAPVRENTQWRDSDRRLLMSLSEELDDGAASRSTYTYDDSGHRLTALSEKRENYRASWEKTNFAEYTYDENGTKVSETRVDYSRGPSSQSCADSYLPGYQITVRR